MSESRLGVEELLEQRHRRGTVAGRADSDASTYAGSVVLPSTNLQVSSCIGIRTRIWKCLLLPSAGPMRARMVIYGCSLAEVIEHLGNDHTARLCLT